MQQLLISRVAQPPARPILARSLSRKICLMEPHPLIILQETVQASAGLLLTFVAQPAQATQPAGGGARCPWGIDVSQGGQRVLGPVCLSNCKSLEAREALGFVGITDASTSKVNCTSWRLLRRLRSSTREMHSQA